MGRILFHDYKSKADTLKIKLDLVCLIRSATLLTWRKKPRPVALFY